MSASVRILCCSLLLATIVFGTVPLAFGVEGFPMVDAPSGPTIYELQLAEEKRQADLANQQAKDALAAASRDAAMAEKVRLLSSQTKALAKYNDSLLAENTSLTKRVVSAEASLSVISEANRAASDDLKAAKRSNAQLLLVTSRSPFDLTDSGNALLALVAAAVGAFLAAIALLGLRGRTPSAAVVAVAVPESNNESEHDQ